MNDNTVIAPNAQTIDAYPNNRLLENVATISEKIPNAGNTRIYTSGCPHAQIRLIYIMGFPPISDVKKCMPSNRSSERSVSVTVKIGKANATSDMLHSTDHAKIGIFISVMPGARILNIVTIKLIPDNKLPIPDICSAHIQ